MTEKDPKQPSSKRRAATRATRTRQAGSGEPYTEARRRSADPAADSVPPMVWPAPVAVMFARHLRAAWTHLGAARRLASDNGAPIQDKRVSFATGARVETSDGPLAETVRKTHRYLWDLTGWANRTAVASGVVQVVPSPFGGNPAEKTAEQTLYPRAYDQWCDRPGKTLPQPGEVPAGEEDAPHVQFEVRHSLPGPVPADRLAAHATGHGLVPARDVVPGTPAAPVWDAAAALDRWACQWMYRAADSPADLAAVLDGLAEVVKASTGVLHTVLEQIDRRTVRGSLTGMREHALAFTENDDDPDRARMPFADISDRYAATITDLRNALDGTRPALPAADTARIPASVIRTAAGKTYAQLRELYGSEVFGNRQVERVRPADYTTADGLRRIVQWMHVSGAQVYDPAAHAAADPAARV